MFFMKLDSTIYSSFLISIRKTVTNILKESNYSLVHLNDSFVTIKFVHHVVEELEKIRSFQRWGQVDFDIDIEEMTKLLKHLEKSMRKRNSTLKQKNHFRRLLYDLKIKEAIPEDYLYLKRRLVEMEGSVVKSKKCKKTLDEREDLSNHY
ncbi:hypothetical protein [Bacillus mycoides]|uniref:hypothetical protein n=1 Tax=Bacillus mycoides TaxID=1405 RepID=UPI000BFC36BC|nr:hypothetical protein [Bacillus mycoides]MCQ6529851.1 hypothetical protein [Bacillus mycoides]PGT49537.1 hypothetical protein COD14_31730 [Bacillus cereus]